MKNIFRLLVLSLLLIGCSIEGIHDPIYVIGPPGADGLNGVDGKDGVDGYNSLIDIEVIQESDTYPYGGVMYHTGLDTNRDGTLQVEEREFSTFITNGSPGANGQDGEDGKDGINSYIKIQHNTPEEGYYTVIVWSDLNGNGTLDEGEQTDTFTLRDGTDGEDGEDGTDGDNGNDGNDGKTTYISVEIIEPGELCPDGGLAITTGYVGEPESYETVYVCCCGCDEEEDVYVCMYEKNSSGIYYHTWLIKESDLQRWLDAGATEGKCED